MVRTWGCEGVYVPVRIRSRWPPPLPSVLHTAKCSPCNQAHKKSIYGRGFLPSLVQFDNHGEELMGETGLGHRRRNPIPRSILLPFSRTSCQAFALIVGGLVGHLKANMRAIFGSFLPTGRELGAAIAYVSVRFPLPMTALPRAMLHPAKCFLCHHANRKSLYWRRFLPSLVHFDGHDGRGVEVETGLCHRRRNPIPRSILLPALAHHAKRFPL